MDYKSLRNKNIIIVLDSLVAEGCPQLALQLISYWERFNIKASIFILNDTSNDMRNEFERMNIKIYKFNLYVQADTK